MSGLHSQYSIFYTRYSNADYKWVQYVHDHFRRLRSKAIFIELNPYKMHEMHYRLCDFLAEHNVPREADWIVLFLNQMGSDAEFKNMKWMFLPDMADIEDMRQMFDTVTAHVRSVRTK